MLKDDIIEKVTEPTPWKSPIVVVPKPGNLDKIRICADMRAANKAILPIKHITPTIDELLIDLNGAQYFSKLDLNAGYHQFELAPDSRYITTILSHLGLFRYKRFDVKPAAEAFQNEISSLICDISNTTNISDDILIWGRTKQEHDNQ